MSVGDDDKAIDHDTGLVDCKVSKVFHNVFQILVGSNIIIANQKVHEA